MSKILKMVLIFSVVVCVVVSSSLLWHFPKEGEKQEWKGSYELKIEISLEGEGIFTLYMPIPVNENKSCLNITDELNVIGNCSYEIISTEYGKAIKLSGYGDVIIEAKGNKTLPPAWFSMSNSTEIKNATEFWVYCNKSSSVKGIEIYGFWLAERYLTPTAGERCLSELFRTTISEEGWQTVEGRSDHVLA